MKRKKIYKMKNLFNKNDSLGLIKKYSVFPEELALRVYTSRLLGSNPSLVLHGGGNTSVKTKIKDITGEEKDVIYVKGSGMDLCSICPDGFSGLNIAPLIRLGKLDSLSDEDMDNQLKINRIMAESPPPSVETLVHAFLPHKYIDHTHADSIMILTNHKNGKHLVRDALGEKVAVIDYIMSGFPLAKAVLREYENNSELKAVVVMNHGIFTFADDAKTSYGRMIDFVDRAEKYIEEKIKGISLFPSEIEIPEAESRRDSMGRFVQAARGACAFPLPDGKIRRFHVKICSTPDLIAASWSSLAQKICASGVLTPDHVIRTKNKMIYIESVPENDHDLNTLVEMKVNQFKEAYMASLQNYAPSSGINAKETDPYPRLFLVAGIGLVALGFTRKDALIAADIGEHTILAKLRGEAMGGYLPISEDHIFDMEFWGFQQKKVKHLSPGLLEGMVALVTGAAGAIGFGVAKQLLKTGAVVALADLDEKKLVKAQSILADEYGEDLVTSIVFDVTDYQAVEKAFTEISIRLGGIDLLVPNAGIAHVATIEELDPDKFDKVIDVNLKGTFNVMKAVAPIFKRQNTGGNIVVISTKNVFDPGAAFGAYSASKAGAHQISKIAAIEFAQFDVRVNMINPDAVFGDAEISSKLWDLIGPARMKSRGLDPEGLKEYYINRNLLKKPVLAEHVGNGVVFFASGQTPTTGASLPVDGGNSAAFPR